MLRSRPRRGAHVSLEPPDPARPRPRPQGRHKRPRGGVRLIGRASRVFMAGAGCDESSSGRVPIAGDVGCVAGSGNGWE